jgi:hypothetical protein
MIAVWAALCNEGILVVLALLALHGSAPPYFDLGGAIVLLPLLAVVLVRAARIAIEADENCVVIRNRYRTRVLQWNEVDQVSFSSRIVAIIARSPAVRFRRKVGLPVYAHAAPRREFERDEVLHQLASCAPSNIKFVSG